MQHANGSNLGFARPKTSAIIHPIHNLGIIALKLEPYHLLLKSLTYPNASTSIS